MHPVTTLRILARQARELACGTECVDWAIGLLEYPRELQAFYNLSFAWEDLQISEEQWYWAGAIRDNIDQIMREEAEAFVARGGVY